MASVSSNKGGISDSDHLDADGHLKETPIGKGEQEQELDLFISS